jgi:cell division protein FtsN
MAPTEHGGQLELFELTHQPAPRPHRESLRRFFISVRYDQLLLTGVGGLLALTVVFACGVERGKQLVRTERAILARAQSPTITRGPTVTAAEPSPSDPSGPTGAVPKVEGKPKGGSSQPKSAPVPSTKAKAPVKLASDRARNNPKPKAEQGSKSRYAIQIVTYSQPRLAKKELDRLLARGERAFLVIRNGRTTLYVGPFPSRDNASNKLTTLKPTYQDCFLRAL